MSQNYDEINFYLLMNEEDFLSEAQWVIGIEPGKRRTKDG